MYNDCQRVQIAYSKNPEWIPFVEALDKRESLIKLKKEIEADLKNTNDRLNMLTQSIENACNHKWCNETNYSAGEKEKWSYCKICGKLSSGHNRNNT